MGKRLIWNASKKDIKKSMLKGSISMMSAMCLLLFTLLLEYFIEPFGKTIVLVLILAVIGSLILGTYLVFRNFKKLKKGELAFEIREDGVRLLNGKFVPKEDIEFVFIDFNREKWGTIKTKNTSCMNIDEKLLSDYKKFFFSIPWRDRLKNDFQRAPIPDMDEFIKALRKCDIDVYICREGRKKVEKVR